MFQNIDDFMDAAEPAHGIDNCDNNEQNATMMS